MRAAVDAVRTSRSSASTATRRAARPRFARSRLALPLIGAGKSLRFALLPEGQDPDDLARSGGPEAIARSHRPRPAVRGNAVPARDRGPDVRHAGKARRAGAAPARADRPRSPTKPCANIMPRTWRQRLAALFGPGAAPRSAGAARGTGRAPAPRRRLRPGSARSASPARRCRRRGWRSASRATRRGKSLILAVLSATPACSRETGEDVAGLEFASAGARRLPDPPVRPRAGGATPRARGAGGGARGGGPRRRARAHSRRCRENAGSGGVCGPRRTLPTPSTCCAKLWPCNASPGRYIRNSNWPRRRWRPIRRNRISRDCWTSSRVWPTWPNAEAAIEGFGEIFGRQPAAGLTTRALLRPVTVNGRLGALRRRSGRRFGCAARPDVCVSAP